MCKLLHVNSSILGMASLGLNNGIQLSEDGFEFLKRYIESAKGLKRGIFFSSRIFFKFSFSSRINEEFRGISV